MPTIHHEMLLGMNHRTVLYKYTHHKVTFCDTTSEKNMVDRLAQVSQTSDLQCNNNEKPVAN